MCGAASESPEDNAVVLCGSKGFLLLRLSFLCSPTASSLHLSLQATTRTSSQMRGCFGRSIAILTPPLWAWTSRA